MILRNKTEHMQIILNKKVRAYRTVVVDDKTEYNKEVFERIDKIKNIKKQTKGDK